MPDMASPSLKWVGFPNSAYTRREWLNGAWQGPDYLILRNDDGAWQIGVHGVEGMQPDLYPDMPAAKNACQQHYEITA